MGKTLNIILWIAICYSLVGVSLVCAHWRKIQIARRELYEIVRNGMVGASLKTIEFVAMYRFLRIMLLYVIEAPVYHVLIIPIKSIFYRKPQEKKKKERRRRCRKQDSV